MKGEKTVLMKELKRKIDSEVITELSQHGGMFFVSLPKRFVEYHNLELGDVLRIKILESKRIRPDEKSADEF
jgi:hypothetical protein